MTLRARLYYIRHPRRSRRHFRAVRAPWPPLPTVEILSPWPPPYYRPTFPETAETLRILAREAEESSSR